MSQETEWGEEPNKSPQKTVPYQQTPAEIEEAEQVVAEEWKAGDTILDLYEVKGVLGEGGFGKVYRVHHKGWNIDLAVKTPLAKRLDEIGKENFKQEAETWVNLGLHLHTVSCYYVRDLGGIPRVFAEYMEGGSVDDWIKDKRLYEGGAEKALERILDISIQFAWGLHYAHEQGLVHQDVKPGNVMMTGGGVTKVTDFGLAKARTFIDADSQSVTDPAKSIVILGSGAMSPAYASPEQATGKPLTRKTDIWSWAVSVLEMFAGGLFWQAGQYVDTSLEDYLENQSDDEYLSDQPKIEIPEAVAALLRKCFQYEPGQRPRDMMEVADILQRLYQEITGEAYPRQLPKASEGLADSLNNRAVSLLDLGKVYEAITLWDEALRIQPEHVEATYNRGLVLWRACRITDDVLVKDIEELRVSHPNKWIVNYLLGLVHLERDDIEAAVEEIESIRSIDANRNEVKTALGVARARGPHPERALRTLKFDDSEPFTPTGKNERALWKEYIYSKVPGTLSANGKYALLGRGNTLNVLETASGQCIRTFEGHEDKVSSVSLSTDGNYALSGSWDKSVKLWEAHTGKCLRTFEGHEGEVISVSLRADGRYALSVSLDGTLRLWEVASGECVRTFNSAREISAALTANGKYAISGGEGNSVKVWEIATGQCVKTFVCDEMQIFSVTSISLSTDGKYVLSGSENRILKLWNVATGDSVRTFEGHTSAVFAVSLSADGRYAVSGDQGSTREFPTLRLWDVVTGRCLRTFESHTGSLYSASLSANGRNVLASTSDAILLWNFEESDYRAQFAISHIVTSETATNIDAIARESLALAQKAFINSDAITAASQIRQLRSLPGYERYQEAFELWAKLYLHLPRKALRGSWEEYTLTELGVDSIKLSADGKYALSTAWRELKLWDVETGQCVRMFKGHGDENINLAVLSPDDRHVLSGSSCGVLKLWEAETGNCLLTFEGRTKDMLSAYIRADGIYALLENRDDTTFSLWEITTNKCLRIFEGHYNGVGVAILSADARYVLSNGHDWTVKLWDVETSQCLRTFENKGRAGSISLSSNGNYALSGSEYGVLKLWEVKTGDCLWEVEAHEDSINSVSLSADGKYALTGSVDRLIKLWEVATGKCMRVFKGHQDMVNSESVSLSADGKHVLSSSLDNTIKLWALDWELDDCRPANWDEGVREHLRIFLRQQTPYLVSLSEDYEPTETTSALAKGSKPSWSEEDFQRLLYTLGCVGYGWLRPEGVRRELEKMTAQWSSSEAEHAASAPPLKMPPDYYNNELSQQAPVRCHVCASPHAVGEKYCPTCGASVRLGEAVGSPLIPVNESTGSVRVSCPSCKSEQTDASLYCEVCGAKLSQG